MPVDLSELDVGRIIWVRLSDNRGVIKRRPAIVLDRKEHIIANEPIAVMAISTSYPEPAPADHVNLPWHSDRRRVMTRLNRRSAAVVNWIRMIDLSDIEEVTGRVPTALMIDIAKRIPELR